MLCFAFACFGQGASLRKCACTHTKGNTLLVVISAAHSHHCRCCRTPCVHPPSIGGKSGVPHWPPQCTINVHTHGRINTTARQRSPGTLPMPPEPTHTHKQTGCFRARACCAHHCSTLLHATTPHVPGGASQRANKQTQQQTDMPDITTPQHPQYSLGSPRLTTVVPKANLLLSGILNGPDCLASVLHCHMAPHQPCQGL